MSDTRFTHADKQLHGGYKTNLGKGAVETGRTNSRTDRVDRQTANEKMKSGWEEKEYAYP